MVFTDNRKEDSSPRSKTRTGSWAVLVFLVLILIIILVPIVPPLKIRVDLPSYPKQTGFQVFYDTGQGFNEQESVIKYMKVSKKPVTVTFELPARKIKRIRIDPAYCKATLLIHSISIKWGPIWHASDISTHFIPTNHIRKFAVEGKNLLIESIGLDPQLESRVDFEPIYQSNQLFYRFIGILLALIVALIYFMLVNCEIPLIKGYGLNKSRMGSYAVILMIGTLLWLPIIQIHFELFPEVISTEKRMPVKAPDSKLLKEHRFKEYLREYENYFNDHFGFRNLLVKLNHFSHVRFFNESPVATAMIGQKGWFYFQTHLGEMFGYNLFKPKELSHIYQKLLNTHRILQAKGIYFLVLLVPDKHSIYPEFLPSIIKQARLPYSRMDQLLAFFKAKKAPFPVIDVRAEIISAKKSYLLYPRSDSHWNSYGSFLAAQKILFYLARKFPHIVVPKQEQFEIAVKKIPGGDLAGLLSIPDLAQDETIEMKSKTGNKAQTVPTDYKSQIGPFETKATEIPKSPFPRLLAFGDSFLYGPMQFISESFSRSVLLVGIPFGLDIIDKERPGVVIYEATERTFNERLRQDNYLK